MKTLISLVTLITIVSTYFLGASLYMQDQLFFAYSLVVASIVSLTFWIKSNDLLEFFERKA
jgi:hypothetical protein